jgi:hypothetical protein
MIKTSQYQTTIFNKTIYKTTTTTGWAVVIMPDGVLIDNYHHGFVHIHPDPDEHELRLQIKEHSQKNVCNIVCRHIHFYEGLKVEKLIKELK